MYWNKNMNKLLTVAFMMLAFSQTARADDSDDDAFKPLIKSVREERPWTVTLGGGLSNTLPLVRVELSDNIVESVYLSASFEIGPNVLSTALGCYVHFLKKDTSGHSMLIGGQLSLLAFQGNLNNYPISGSGVGFGISPDIGWEYRSRNGFTVRAFAAIGVPEHPVRVEIVFPVYVKSTPANLAVPALRNSDVSVRCTVPSPLVVFSDNVDL